MSNPITSKPLDVKDKANGNPTLPIPTTPTLYLKLFINILPTSLYVLKLLAFLYHLLTNPKNAIKNHKNNF